MSSTEQLNFTSNKTVENKVKKKSKKKNEKRSEQQSEQQSEKQSEKQSEQQNNNVKDNRPHPLKVLLDAVSMAQSRGAYSMNEIGIILEAYNYLSHQFNHFQVQEDTEEE